MNCAKMTESVWWHWERYQDGHWDINYTYTALPSVQTLWNQPFSGWMTKPVLPAWRLGYRYTPAVGGDIYPTWTQSIVGSNIDTTETFRDFTSVFSSASFDWQYNAYTSSSMPEGFLSLGPYQGGLDTLSNLHTAFVDEWLWKLDPIWRWLHAAGSLSVRYGEADP